MSLHVDGKAKLTYEEYRHFPDDGRRHEIIDGEHYVSPVPGTRHQSVSRHIQFALYREIEETGRGYVFNAPTDLQLAETDVVQPDLIVVLAHHLEIILPSRIRGVPDLVVEILSPSTAQRDRSLKHGLYEHHGVPEYWLVDADEQVVTRFSLEGGATYSAGAAHAESVSFAGATIDLEEVWHRLHA